MNRSKLRRVGLISAVLLAVAAMIVYALVPSPILVETGRVSRGPFQVTVDEEGQTRARDRFVMSSPIPGRLMRVKLEEGDPVKQGQVLARIEPLPLNQREREEVYARVEAAEASLRQARAREAHARADRGQARRDRYRAEKLAENGVISSQALDQARNADVTAADELDAAEHAVQMAASEVQVARAGLVGIEGNSGRPRRWIELRSPVDGKVLRVIEESERVVQSGTPIVVIGQTTRLEIVTDVLSTDAVNIQPGALVLLEGWGGDHPIRARVRFVEPAGFTKVSALGIEEQRVNVISDFVDPPGRLEDGYRVESKIVTWSGHDVLKVPLSAVFRRGQGWSAFVVDSGRARIRDVTIGHRNESEVEILGGLEEGQQIILHPPNDLREGMRVRRK